MRIVRIALISAVLAPVLLSLPAALASPPSSPASSGGHIVFASFGRHAGIFVMNPDGTGRHRVIDVPSNWTVGTVAVSPDGSTLAMTFGPHRYTHIYLARIDGSHLHRLGAANVSGADPSFSPDGSQIVFDRSVGRRELLYVMNTDGTGMHKITTSAQGYAAFPSWSPDGTMIAFDSYTTSSNTIMVTDPSGSSFRTIFSIPRKQGQPFGESWTPDSATIAFSLYTDRFRRADIWSIGADGSNLTQVTDSTRLEVGVAYSPDGSRIVTSYQDVNGLWADLMVMNADGTDRHRMDEPGETFVVAWGG